MDLLKFVPEKYRFWKKDNRGNILVGNSQINTEGGEVAENVLIGENVVESKAPANGRVSITGNKLIGKNKIIIK